MMIHQQTRLWWVVVLTCLFLLGCSEQSTSNKRDVHQSTDEYKPTGFTFGNRAHDSLWAKGELALREGRTVAPAGNNAVEFYLQIRQAYPGIGTDNTPMTPAQQSLMDALNRLAPDVSLAIDQAVTSKKLGEASRLVRMLAAIDAEHPSLDRHIREIEQAKAKAKPKSSSKKAKK